MICVCTRCYTILSVHLYPGLIALTKVRFHEISQGLYLQRQNTSTQECVVLRLSVSHDVPGCL